MKALLNNPWVVGVLCLAAAVTVYLRLFDSKSSSSSPPLFEQTAVAAIPTPVQLQSGVTPEKNQAVDTREEGVPIVGKWIDKIVRDPFRRGKVEPESSSEEEEPDDEQDEVLPVNEPLRLHAIFVNGSNRIAVINKTFVKVGDRVSGFLVSQIKSDGVWLQDATEQYWLEFGPSQKQEQVS